MKKTLFYIILLFFVINTGCKTEPKEHSSRLIQKTIHVYYHSVDDTNLFRYDHEHGINKITLKDVQFETGRHIVYYYPIKKKNRAMVFDINKNGSLCGTMNIYYRNGSLEYSKDFGTCK